MEVEKGSLHSRVLSASGRFGSWEILAATATSGISIYHCSQLVVCGVAVFHNRNVVEGTSGVCGDESKEK